MTDIISSFFDPDNEFLRLAFYLGTLASLSFGIIGTYVVTKRISYIAGSISHCIFGGIGLSLYLKNAIHLQWIEPIYGAVFAALLSAIIIGLVTIYSKQREDTVIGALWAIGMASGLLFMDITPGYFNISSYLFGDILLISKNDIKTVIILDVLIISIVIFFYNKLLAVCFDEEFANLRGINTKAIYILLLCLTSLTIVLLVRIVGIIMVIAFLTLPPGIACYFSKKLWKIMIISIILCSIFTWSGLIVSFNYSLSTGPTIIIISGFFYLLTIILSYFRK